MPLIPDAHKKKAAWLTICVGLCGSAEGLRQTAYRDVTGTATVCFGETRGVKMTDRYTSEQCREMLGGRLEEFAAGVDRCTTVELPPERKAAFVDFAYNNGVGAYCEHIAPEINAGEIEKACDHLLRFNKSKGIVFPGLTKRRAAERELCLRGM